MNNDDTKQNEAGESPSSTEPVGAAGPAPTARARGLHWLAWVGAIVSLVVGILWMWGSFSARNDAILQGIDLGLGLFFAVEFFTRTGWRRSRLNYLKWRWFDVIAIVPVTVLGPFAFAAVVWIILACRAIRLVDRTLGDGFVQRKFFMVLSMAEEELSDRVLVKMLSRWERELEHAKFGTVMAAALSRNKADVLARVYAEQLQDGTFAKFAHFTGLQAALEKEEERIFSALIEMVGSAEVDAAIRDVIASSLQRSRRQLLVKDWRRKVGAPTPPVLDESPTVTPGAPRRTPAVMAEF